jgi:hypothetical protein
MTAGGGKQALQVVHRMTNEEAERVASVLAKSAYDGDVIPLNRRQRVSDEQLVRVFKAIEGKWLPVERLRETLGSFMELGSPGDKKHTVISSHYLVRLRKLTGKRWRQKRALDPKGNYLVKVWTQR